MAGASRRIIDAPPSSPSEGAFINWGLLKETLRQQEDILRPTLRLSSARLFDG